MSRLNDTNAWKELQHHSEQFQHPEFRLSDLFADSGSRFQSFSLRHENLLLDFSKNFLKDETLRLLLELAEELELPKAIEAMFAGEKINSTEQRPALHTALRAPRASSNFPEVSDSLSRIEKLVNQIHSGQWKGYSNKKIENVVNIGIGGSDLGPAMATSALSQFAKGAVQLHFVSNIDPSHLESTLKGLDPETTLFVVASKSFNTLETLQNAMAARAWLIQQSDDESRVAKHFVAISTNAVAAHQFGIADDNLFPVWDWVGGRFSLWSAIGLPIALSIGMENFRQLLAGAHSMDLHFQNSKLSENMPVVMALLTFWYGSFFNAHSSAVTPYSQNLNLLPSFLQQLYMESLGKSTDLQGNPVTNNTAEVLWGTAGTNGQHSYFQLLHQGTEFIPVDFIACATSSSNSSAQQSEQQQQLLANCFSQSLALMTGTTNGRSGHEENSHKQVAGNKPSNTLLLSKLDPFTLGSLIALYEHKVYVLSVLWNINAFDQWGVELGKKLSTEVFEAIQNPSSSENLDDSTANLIKLARDWSQND